MLLTVKKTDPYPISIYIWNSVGYMDRQLYHPYIYFSQVDENMAWARGVASKHWEYIGFNWEYIGFGGSIQEHYGVVVEYRLDLAFDGSENAKHSKHSRITARVNTNCHPNGSAYQGENYNWTHRFDDDEKESKWLTCKMPHV